MSVQVGFLLGWESFSTAAEARKRPLLFLFDTEGNPMASVADLYIDHPPVQIIGIKVNCVHKQSREFGDKYIVAAQTPYGKLESNVDPVVFQAAENLKDDPGVLLHIVPRQEQVKGQFNKGGYFFQFDVVDVTTVPAEFGKLPKSSNKPEPLSKF